MSAPNSAPPLWFYILIFLEGWIFPIPPDPFYIPQVLNRPQKAWTLAFQCTILSVLGGCMAYYLGFAFYDTFGKTFISYYGCTEMFSSFAHSMKKWGGFIIAAKGFTPFPYKIVCLVAGMTRLSWITFVFSSLFARGIRFYAIAFLSQHYGSQVGPVLKKYRFWIHLLWVILFIGGSVWMGFFCFKIIQIA